ncbi:hypothetical protein [Mycobacterium marinum]|uniref:hypothetical protein n=1 Tax=Mycobacterium marinum TaxID=1781 RepID=UPI000E3DD6CD|nr:hypothetical protein [Mycobacterium marinum]RFZ01463.1 hypothetical protein VIMS_05709 [Mycobacterium marinum]WCS16355.1 hypothetical protein MML61_15280 [Mycobacterium marinum]
MPGSRWMKGAVVIGVFGVVLTTIPPVAADTSGVVAPPSPTAPCDAISPIAVPCVALGKATDAFGAECRRVGIADAHCVLPLAHKVTQAARDAYLQSWVHRVAQFQYALQDALPLRQAQWLGTHNSFNSLSESFTPSHADSNQQLSLAQQLDIDVRALELDLHYIRRLDLVGGRGVTVCHGLGPDKANLGCTTEPAFGNVLPEIANWLGTPAHSDQVILLYLEDELKDARAYASAVGTLDGVLRRPDGSSLIYRPNPAQRAADGCVRLPLNLSRNDVRASGAQVVVVGSCASGWASDVFNWDGVEVEKGSTSGYRAYPACDATYGAGTYASRLVRYYEDSTLVSALVKPTRPPTDPEALAPAKAKAMTDCGVNLFGFDQLLPEDGRIQASLWSWAPDEPRAGAGECTLQDRDGRWVSAPCTDPHPAACVTAAGTWAVTSTAVTFAGAPLACTAAGADFALPRSGDQNARLHAVSSSVGGAWVQYTLSPGT